MGGRVTFSFIRSTSNLKNVYVVADAELELELDLDKEVIHFIKAAPKSSLAL